MPKSFQLLFGTHKILTKLHNTQYFHKFSKKLIGKMIIKKILIFSKNIKLHNVFQNVAFFSNHIVTTPNTTIMMLLSK